MIEPRRRIVAQELKALAEKTNDPNIPHRAAHIVNEESATGYLLVDEFFSPDGELLYRHAGNKDGTAFEKPDCEVS